MVQCAVGDSGFSALPFTRSSISVIRFLVEIITFLLAYIYLVVSQQVGNRKLDNGDHYLIYKPYIHCTVVIRENYIFENLRELFRNRRQKVAEESDTD